MRVGVIGIGLMGAPIATNYLKAGFEVTVFNRTIEKCKALEEEGAKVAKDIPELLSNSDTIILMLPDYASVSSALKEHYSALNGKTIIQMSTISPNESEELNEIAGEFGINYFEAPVLGSIPQIKEKSLIILFGGKKSEYEEWKSFFAHLGKKIEYCGEIGKASAMKLGLNQLIASLTAAFSMSLGFIRESELDIDLFMNILRESALYAPTYDKKLGKMMERNFDNPNFPLKHLLKDLDLIRNSFGDKGINIAPLDGVRRVIEDALSQGLAEKDYSSLYNGVHYKE